MKTIVTVSRKWDKPEIECTVYSRDESDRYVEINIKLDDFISALKQELKLGDIRKNIKDDVGSVTMVFTKSEIESRIDKAVDNINISYKIDRAVETIIKTMKEEWIKHPD